MMQDGAFEKFFWFYFETLRINMKVQIINGRLDSGKQ